MADACTARPDTPQNNVLQGLIPHITKSAGYQTPGTTFKYEYFREFETEFKNFIGFEFVDYMGWIRGKYQKSTISCFCPFKASVVSLIH
jgi:hypothetical protein